MKRILDGRLVLIFFLLTGGLENSLEAQTIVMNNTELQSALSSAVAGSEIVLKNQVWTDVNMNIKVTGTAEQPVIIRAETTGAVFIEGNSSIHMGGSYIKVDGFVFRNASDLVVSAERIDPIIEFRDNTGAFCNSCALTNVTIDSYNGTEAQAQATFKWIIVYGQNNEISYSSFLGKYGVGSIINDNRNESDPDYTKIHHNYFADRTPVGAFNNLNDQDAIRIGNSSTSLSDSFTEVYDNYFNNFSGEIEIISNKSGKNKYYNNTFRNYNGSLTLRHGNECEVYSNYFFANKNYSTAGVRVIGERHQVYNNYIEGINSKKEGGSSSGATGGINITNGRENSALNGYYQVIGAKIVNNTFVDCDYGIRVGTKVSSDLSLAPVDLEISNNIMLNSSNRAISVTTPATGNSIYQGNITQNGSWDIDTDTNGNIVSASGLLEMGTLFYRIVTGSLAIDASLGSYAFVVKDLLGGNRTGSIDAGAEELGANGTHVPYTNEDIGVLVGFGANVEGEIPVDLSVSISELNFSESAGSKSFTIFSNINWTIETSAEWLTVDPDNGSNSKEVSAIVLANETVFSRTGTITINNNSGDESVTVTVVQPGETPIDAPRILGMSVTGEGTEDPNIPENTLDEDDETRWSGQSDDGSSFLTYNLKDIYTLSHIRMKFLKGDQRTSSFKVLVSQNGTQFANGTEVLTSSGTTLGYETFELENTFPSARYIRIAGYGNSEGSGWNSYVEVQFYGVQGDNVTGLNDDLGSAGYQIFPNPAINGFLEIHSNGNVIGQVQLIDLSGKIVLNKNVQLSEAKIDVSMFRDGFYILSIPGVGKKKVLLSRQ